MTRTVVTQRLQSAAAKRAMAKARVGHRDLSGLWGGGLAPHHQGTTAWPTSLKEDRGMILGRS